MLVHAQGMLENVKTNGLFENVDFIFKFLIGFISNYSHAFAVNGFFILSSFLLTYRLLEDYSKGEDEEEERTTTIHHLLRVSLKFFIRRFFRVYLPYALFCTLVTVSPEYAGGNLKYASLTKMLTLKETGSTPLWTVPPEIKYYFLLPLICLPMAAFGKRLTRLRLNVAICLLVALNLINMPLNVFNVKTVAKGYPLWEDQNETLKFCMQTF
jgi:peptidoglycan/LPS O-acetylase OafA/YrhL